jgi:RHS repeat-associated protein
VTAYAYDLNNNLTTLTDAQGGVTSYAFDPRNLLIVETYPDNGARSYTYDAAHRLIKRVDQSSAATGYIYDMAGRMVERAYPAGTGNDTFVYDNASRLLTATSAQYNNAVTRVYDSANRLTSETLTVGATPYSIGYGYDADNRQTHVTYPDGSIAVRNFTDRNQLSVVTFNNALVANFAYDNAGRKVGTAFGNGITEARTYQADNLNTAINTPGVTSFGYTWDANKRKLSQTETGIPTNDQVYTYDNEDRLTGFNRNNGDTQTWNLSLVGDWNNTIINGTQQNRTHNAVHEITTVDANPLVHDVKGNLATNKNGQTYAWDFENRLTAAAVPTGCPEGVAGTHTYTYDALGRRVSKTVGATTTVFVSDGMQEIAEYVNGAFSQSYVYGSYIDEPLLKTDNAGNKIYYHANNLFSIAALTDAAGNVVERYKYDTYGKQTILAPDGITVRPSSLHGNRVGHTGRTKDDETGLVFYRARIYSPELGRFIGRDPIGYVDGRNLYEYGKSRPIVLIDPSGLLTIEHVSGPDEKNCGIYSLKTAFKLDKAQDVGGFIIMKVEITVDIKNCDGTEKAKDSKTYWELWGVERNKVRTQIFDLTKGWDDKFESEIDKKNTRGFIEQVGTANYWHGRRAPASMVVGEVPEAGGLHSTDKDPIPNLGAATEGPATKKIKVEWDCCGDKPTCVVKSQEPKKPQEKK